VTSLARPTGNVTGVYLQTIDVVVKQLQFVKEAFPGMQPRPSSGIEFRPTNGKAARDASAQLGVRLAGIELREPAYDYEQALAQAPPDHRGSTTSTSYASAALPSGRDLPPTRLMVSRALETIRTVHRGVIANVPQFSHLEEPT
jgi:hypothetical protein